MKLTLEQIRSAALGAARITGEADGIHFYRFTEAQEELYQKASPDNFYGKTFASAGIRLEFLTDSKTLTLEVTYKKSSSRLFAHTDILVNGRAVGHLGSGDYACCLFGNTYQLGDGIKTVQLYFPWSVSTTLRNLTLDDGSVFIPAGRSKKMLIYGDSITHGYDCRYPSHSYASILADRLGADARNKAIGGERFFVPLANEAEEEGFLPDYITVAYGTNDWAGEKTPGEIEKKIDGFYSSLSALYPAAKIFALTPIWRGDADEVRADGNLWVIARMIEKTAKTLPNVTVIRGDQLIPHDDTLYSPDVLHPNDAGSAYYAQRLWDAIRKLI